MRAIFGLVFTVLLLATTPAFGQMIGPRGCSFPNCNPQGPLGLAPFSWEGAVRIADFVTATHDLKCLSAMGSTPPATLDTCLDGGGATLDRSAAMKMTDRVGIVQSLTCMLGYDTGTLDAGDTYTFQVVSGTAGSISTTGCSVTFTVTGSSLPDFTTAINRCNLVIPSTDRFIGIQFDADDADNDLTIGYFKCRISGWL